MPIAGKEGLFLGHPALAGDIGALGLTTSINSKQTYHHALRTLRAMGLRCSNSVHAKIFYLCHDDSSTFSMKNRYHRWSCNE